MRHTNGQTGHRPGHSGIAKWTQAHAASPARYWRNCSSKRNLSFNWRLILAPDFVLRYLVTHEAVHLAIPDHSAKFWLAVQSVCRETEKAKQWLCANGHRLAVDFDQFSSGSAFLRDNIALSVHGKPNN